MRVGGPPRVVVVGSINMDLVARVARLPRAGETVAGTDLLHIPGGKGANQAVAVARLGGRSSLLGRVGDDGFGAALVEALAGAGVDIGAVTVTPRTSSGVALIGVDDAGQNAITIIAGANGRLTAADVAARSDLIEGADALLVQLEVPLETIAAALGVARRAGVLTVLDPAPAPAGALPSELLALVDVISPNQTEAEALTGLPVETIDAARAAAARLRGAGVARVVLKLGAAGAFLSESGGLEQHVPAAAVPVVDTTAAGDAFTGALTLALAEGRDPVQAVRRGCAAGTLAAMRLGAQQSMPAREELEAFLEKRS
jgi:ribokinase